MKNLLLCIFAFFSIGSEAGLVVDLSGAQVVNSNDRYGIIGKRDGFLNTVLFSDSASLTTVSVSFVGSQAKYHNQFLMQSAEENLVIDNHPSDACCLIKATAATQQTASVNYSANQLLDFMFTVDQLWDGPDIDWSVKNGYQKSNPLASKDVYFWLGVERNNAGDVESLLLGLDDGGGWPTPDKDHDDLVVRLSGFGALSFINNHDAPPSVPLPNAAGLLMSALLVLTGFVKKQKKVAV
jgi:hypothetical protein